MLFDELRKANMQALKDKNSTARSALGLAIDKAMKIKIEKQSKNNQRINTITPEIAKNKLSSSPNMVFIFKKKTTKLKKGNKRNISLLMKKAKLTDYSFKNKDKKKRNRSFDISERY